MCCQGKRCGLRKFNISSRVSCINLLSTHNSESRSYHKMHVVHADLGMHLCSLNIIWCHIQSTCIQMNVSLLRKGYNIRLILLGQIDMLGGNIYPPMHIPGRVAFVYYSFCVSVGAVVLDVAWLFHQLEKENPTYIVKSLTCVHFVKIDTNYTLNHSSAYHISCMLLPSVELF